MFRSRTPFKLCILAVTGMASSAAMAQTTFDEATFSPEPNNSKAAATSVVTIGVTSPTADKLTGACSSTDTDYWHLKMVPLAAGFYRNVLTVTAPTSGTFTHTIRGLSQAAGVINTSSDTAVFTSSVPTTSGRSVSWVGFGKQEELFYSISHSASAATNYTVTYARAAITPIDMTATSLNAGPITIRVHNVSGSLNTDCWLYDGNLNPLVNDGTAGPAGADGALVTTGGGTGTILSSFTRTLPAGTYYLAIGGSNLANTQPSVAADTTGFNSPVMELANSLVCGVSTGSAATFYADFVDSATPTAHTVTSTNIVLNASWGGNVNFVKIMVIQPFLPSGTLSSIPTPAIPGSSTTLSIAVTPGTGGASADITGVTADISALTGNPSPDTLTLTSSNGGVTWTGAAPVAMATTMGNKTIPFTIVEGGSIPGTLNSSGTVTVGPINDMCSGAIAVTPGNPSSPIDNQFAGTNDGPTACAAGGKGIWYRFTPTVDASYQVDTCGSGGNTLLTVYQIGDCADTATWTQLGCNDDRPAGTCSEPQTSAIQNLGMLAGTTYYLRVQSMNNSGTFVTGPVVVNVTQTGTAGACCNNATGACTFTSVDGCPGSTSSYQGDGIFCTPFPCTIAGTCCDNSTGACTTLGPTGSCAANATFNASLACAPTPCAVSGTCCNPTSGACSTIFGGNCAAGSIAGSGTVCNPSACVAIGTCCSISNGACTLLYGGGSCGGDTPNASLTCTPSPCAAVGICCSPTGVCTVNFGAACTGTLNNAVTVCGSGGLPNSACPPTAICCLFASGSCTVIYGGQCNSNAATGTGTTCSPGTPSASCAPSATCCNTTSGACSVIYGGSCSGIQGNGTTCDASACSVLIGACCAQSTGACSTMSLADCAALTNRGTFLGTGVACPGGLCVGEHEPNSLNKGSCTSNPTPPMSSGDSIAGVSTGSQFDPSNNPNGTSSDGFVDMWLFKTAPAAPGIYRHEMGQIQGAASMPWSIRANGQAAGAVVNSNVFAQAATSGSTPTRLMAWYGFGKQEQMILETASGTTVPYVYQLTDTRVSPTVAPGAVAAGQVTIRVVNTGTPTIDSDTWLYDSNFNALVNSPTDGPGGADGQLASNDPAGTTTSFTRTLPAGTYYLAIGPGNISNNQPNDASENISSNVSGGKTVLDYADGLLCTTMGSTAAYTCHVEFSDAASATVVSPDLTWPSTTWYGVINFVQFTVGGSTGVCCRGATCNASLPQAGCSASGTAGAFYATSSGACNSGAISSSPCCFADYNKANSITVQDIFDFLADWFAGNPYANTGGNGASGALTVQNIFDFLSNWFAGGCN